MKTMQDQTRFWLHYVCLVQVITNVYKKREKKETLAGKISEKNDILLKMQNS